MKEGDIVNSAPNDNSEDWYLSKQEETNIKNALLRFVLRVSDSSNNRLPEEIQVLPTTAELLLKGFSNL